MKPFLIIAGQWYYPQCKTHDWIKAYETLEEAQKQIEEIPNNEKYRESYYMIDGHAYDWYTIVDLREWIYES